MKGESDKLNVVPLAKITFYSRLVPKLHNYKLVGRNNFALKFDPTALDELADVCREIWVSLTLHHKHGCLVGLVETLAEAAIASKADWKIGEKGNRRFKRKSGGYGFNRLPRMSCKQSPEPLQQAFLSQSIFYGTNIGFRYVSLYAFYLLKTPL